MKKAIALILAVLLLTVSLTACSGSVPVIDNAAYFDMSAYDTTLPIKFEILMESGEKLEGELYYKSAPITVANFVTLANNGFYDGLIIHRVVPGTLIQGGCQYGDGTSGKQNTEYTIRGEFSDNGWNNTLSHLQGVISMARYADDVNSAYSQFFICAKDQSSLNGDFAAFGKITKGLQYITDMSNVPSTDEMPNEQLVIAEINILGN